MSLICSYSPTFEEIKIVELKKYFLNKKMQNKKYK
jgi:hypothetical protein